MSFDRSLLSAWKCEHNQYLQQMSLQLGADAIQFGLLGLWQQIDLERTSWGLIELNLRLKTEILAKNALKLIQEIIVPGTTRDRSVRNDVRLLGLISYALVDQSNYQVIYSIIYLFIVKLSIYLLFPFCTLVRFRRQH